MIQLINFDQETLDTMQSILKEATTKCSEYYSCANFIGFKRLCREDAMKDGPFNSLVCVKAAKFSWKVRAFSNVKPSVQFKVDMNTDDLVKVNKKTRTLILHILERDYVCRDPQQTVTTLGGTSNTSSGKKNSNENTLIHLIRTQTTMICQ